MLNPASCNIRRVSPQLREATGGPFTSILMDHYELSAGILMRACVCGHSCVCQPASKSSVTIKEKSIQGGSRQTIELFEGESHFPEQFQRIAKLQMTRSHPNLVATLFPQSCPSFIIILYEQ